MTDRRRRPAAASRVLVTGLATATTLALTGAMASSQTASQTPEEAPDADEVSAPAPTVGDGATPRRILVVVRGEAAPAAADAPRPSPPDARPRPQVTTRAS